MPGTGIGGTQGAVFNTILEVRVINMVDHCGYGLFHRIAWYHRPIQIIGPGASDDLCRRKHLLDVSIAAGPYKQFSRAAVFADDGQEAVGVHYPHNFPSMFLLMYAATSRFANWCLRGGGIATVDSL
jgi:hypothetical protein